MHKITPCLWFDDRAEEAANFYVSIFKNSKIKSVQRYDKAASEVSKKPEGSVMTVAFEIEDTEFMALNGGPEFKFSLATSFIVNCDTQEEIDHYWDKLVDGGQAIQCGWLTDKFGVTWQVVPTILDKLIADSNKEKAGRAMKAMLSMVKFDIDELKRAYEG